MLFNVSRIADKVDNVLAKNALLYFSVFLDLVPITSYIYSIYLQAEEAF